MSLKTHWKMITLLKKYAILVVVSIIIIKLLPFAILAIWPDLLTTKSPNGEVRILSRGYLENVIEMVINIIIIVLLNKEMKKEGVSSVPVLILTFFSSLTGVFFFFILMAENKLKCKNLSR